MIDDFLKFGKLRQNNSIPNELSDMTNQNIGESKKNSNIGLIQVNYSDMM